MMFKSIYITVATNADLKAMFEGGAKSKSKRKVSHDASDTISRMRTLSEGPTLNEDEFMPGQIDDKDKIKVEYRCKKFIVS